jgi:phosphoribosylglycinamide formyltransferase-1
MVKKIKVGGLISGSGTNMEAIMKACEENRISAEVVFVGSDNPKAEGLALAEKRKIPTFVVDYKKIIKDFKKEGSYSDVPRDLDLVGTFCKQELKDSKMNEHEVYDFLKTRAVIESSLLSEIKKYDFDLLVLAGFMRVLTPYFIDRINIDSEKPRIMNIHPALLPLFPGTSGYEDTFNYGCKVGGCTVHFIDYGEDTGPIIGQSAISILPGETIKDFKKRGLQEEYNLYPLCIHRFAQGRLKVRKNGNGRKVVDILPRR